MEKIGFGIIGTGSIVNTYVKCIDELTQAKLVALYTKSSERIDSAQKEFGVPVFDDMEQFLKQADVNIVCVCNESGNHGAAIKAAAKAGKHVLSEKPLEVSLEKIDEVIAVCEQQKVMLGCTLQNRCSPEYVELYDAVSQGKLGKLLMGNAHINWYRPTEYYKNNPWRGTMRLDGGAAFMNQGVHTIDLLLNVMGQVNSVFGNVKTLVHDIEGEDVGSAILSFASGAIGTITGGTALYPGYPEKLEVYGEKGSILMEGGEIVQWNVKGLPRPSSTPSRELGSGASDPTAITHLNHKKVIEDMMTAVMENRSPMVDGPEARKAVEVITSIYKSSEEARVVSL
ncbi:Gfo/Idh/MocA family oxidoreductase [uncultured Kriegella sp.]|uniref:Gfo/Idh/MocA family protein n=1 Tax=uncultured Kriegella sp. TaxID=1798910 RepID=UPI0030D72CE9|tara:strand:+ start:77575 stop:78597 length:1023 start_codon:yes stop_codon:yes gene_type:complete